MTEEASLNKRAYPRIPKSVSVHISKLEYPLEQSQVNAVSSKDLNQDGMRIVSNVAYSKGSVLNLKIDLKGWRRHLKKVSLVINDAAFDTPLTAIAEVVWCQKSATEDGQYEAGVRFVNIYEDDLAALKQYLEFLALRS